MSQSTEAGAAITAKAISYTGAAASIGSALTLTEVGILIGIATAILTFLINLIYTYRKNKREQEAHDATLARMRE